MSENKVQKCRAKQIQKVQSEKVQSKANKESAECSVRNRSEESVEKVEK